MNIPLSERGEYYRGLLVLIRKDWIISEEERALMIQLGQRLDFDKRFCENVIDEVMKNPHIKDRPTKFSNRAIAESFLRNAILLSFSDGELHSRERSWLEAVANANGIENEWLSTQISSNL